MLILGIESSCDESGVALYDTDAGLLAHRLYSQVAMHAAYGGVVPELASRDHIRRILPLTHATLRAANRSLNDMDLIAYTEGPGLGGALLVGAGIANGLAFSLDIPVIGIHHLEGHLLSPLLADPKPDFPFVALLVSGGHTQLMAVERIGQYHLLGETVDDAAGEAFDKTASLLGLNYPGGAALSTLAESGNATKYKLPRPMLHSGDQDFSFSGLKTAVATLIKRDRLLPITYPDIAASFEEAIVDVLAAKSFAALKKTGMKQLVVAGGVGANRRLRIRLTAQAKSYGIEVFYPPLEFCTDNGAMIAFAAALRVEHLGFDQTHVAETFSVRPRWPLSSSL